METTDRNGVLTSVDRIDVAIRDIMTNAHEVWTAVNWDGRTTTWQTALGYVLSAGLVEGRWTIDMRHGAAGRRLLEVVATGDPWRDLWPYLEHAIPVGWVMDGSATDEITCWRSECREMRLTSDGEDVRIEMLNGDAAEIVAALRRTGRYARRPSVKPRVRVERILDESAPHATAIAHANASIGDIVIHNVTSTTEADASTQENARKRQATVDEQMAAMLQADASRVEWPARKWAEVLNCSESAVKQTRTWQVTIRSARAMMIGDNMRFTGVTFDDRETDEGEEDQE